MHNPSTILKPVEKASLGVGVNVQKETAAPFTTEENQLIDLLSTIIVDNILNFVYEEKGKHLPSV